MSDNEIQIVAEPSIGAQVEVNSNIVVASTAKQKFTVTRASAYTLAPNNLLYLGMFTIDTAGKFKIIDYNIKKSSNVTQPGTLVWNQSQQYIDGAMRDRISFYLLNRQSSSITVATTVNINLTYEEYAGI